MNELNKILICWEGIQLNQTTKDLCSFRVYFSTSRNWFDQKKKKLKANHFWMAILRIIQQFALCASTQFVGAAWPELQFKHYHHLLQQLMLGILTADISFAATKPQPLLPSGMIKVRCSKLSAFSAGPFHVNCAYILHSKMADFVSIFRCILVNLNQLISTSFFFCILWI